MTIVMNRRILMTEEPSIKDERLLAHMAQARFQWETDGKPQSGQGF